MTNPLIIAKIKEKKELASLDDNYVLQFLERAMTPKIKEKMESVSEKQFFKTKEFDELRSAVRKQLRETYGVFSQDLKKRDQLLEELKTSENKNRIIKQILDTHQSTQERLPYYKKFYEEIFDDCPKKILDIGCGLGPVSLPLSECKTSVVCCDISTQDMNYLNQYFDIMQLDGKAIVADAINRDAIQKIVAEENPDCVFMLKVADTFETLERHSSKKLIAMLAESVPWIVVSFPLVSLGGGKRIHDDRRSWFESFLAKAGWEPRIVDLPNERIYVIKT